MSRSSKSPQGQQQQAEQSQPEPSEEGIEAADQRKMISLRLSAQGRRILERLAREQGISQAAVLEVLLRREAASALLQQPPSTTNPSSQQ